MQIFHSVELTSFFALTQPPSISYCVFSGLRHVISRTGRVYGSFNLFHPQLPNPPIVDSDPPRQRCSLCPKSRKYTRATAPLPLSSSHRVFLFGKFLTEICSNVFVNFDPRSLLIRIGTALHHFPRPCRANDASTALSSSRRLRPISPLACPQANLRQAGRVQHLPRLKSVPTPMAFIRRLRRLDFTCSWVLTELLDSGTDFKFPIPRARASRRTLLTTTCMHTRRYAISGEALEALNF